MKKEQAMSGANAPSTGSKVKETDNVDFSLVKRLVFHFGETEEEVKNLDFDALLVRQTEEYNKVIDARKIRAEQAALETPTDTFTV